LCIISCLAGILGVGGVKEYVEAPMLMNYIPAEKIVKQVSCGLNHTAAVATDGEVRGIAGLLQQEF
jgi:alpha-tubulin suppressor-like RCC1 family protein